MKLSEFSVNKPITTLMVILSVLVLGVISLRELPLNASPEFSFPSMHVMAYYSSSSPEEIEKLITIPLEDVLSTTTHLKQISSTSGNSQSRISLEFEEGTNMDLMALEVRDKIDQVRKDLPDDLRWIRIYRFQFTDRPVLSFTVSWNGPRYKLDDIVTHVLQRRIQRIPGVADVEISGIDENMSSSLRTNNINMSAGYVMDAGKKYSVRVIGEFQEIEEIAETPVKGSDIRISDLAEVSYDFPEKRRFQTLNGSESIRLSVRKNSTANVVDVSRRVRNVLEEIKKEPGMEDMSILIFRDQADEVINSLNNLWQAGVIGAFCASLVLFFFLRKVRSTLIIITAVPISIITSIFIMYISRRIFNVNITLNILSLSGLIVSVGMLFDNSVVVLENIFRHKQEKGADSKKAALEGSGEVALPVIAATATTLIVFVPLIFMGQGRMGLYMQDFGMVMCFAVLASLFVALTLVPLFSSRVFVGSEKEKSLFLIKLTNYYTRVMKFSLRHRWIVVVAAFAVLFGSGFGMYTSIEMQADMYSPERSLEFNVEIPRSYSLDDVKQLFEEIETILGENKEELDIKNYTTQYGIGSSSIGGGGGRGGGHGRGSMYSHGNQVALYLKEGEEGASKTVDAIEEEVKRLLPKRVGVEYRMGGRMNWHGFQSGLQISLKGYSTEVLEIYAEEVKNRISDIPGIKDIDTSLETEDEEVRLYINRDKANKYGFSSGQIARSVSSALSSRATSTYKTENGEVDITLWLQEEDRLNVQQLENLVFENSRGEMIPLSSIADYRIQAGPKSIQREDRRTIVTVTANTDRRGLSQIQDMVSARLEDLALPIGYSWDFGKTFFMQSDFEVEAGFAVLFALVLIYIVMAALFESFIHPFTILCSIPFALIGVFIAFKLTETTLNPISILGILVLMGIVVNNGIILVDAINRYRRRGYSRNDAIVRGGQVRMRPIMMTAATTMLGLLPMILPAIFPELLNAVEGRAAIYGPVGIAIIGGLLTSTFLTLILTPTIYSIVDDVIIWFKRLYSEMSR